MHITNNIDPDPPNGGQNDCLYYKARDEFILSVAGAGRSFQEKPEGFMSTIENRHFANNFYGSGEFFCLLFYSP